MTKNTNDEITATKEMIDIGAEYVRYYDPMECNPEEIAEIVFKVMRSHQLKAGS